MKTLKGTRMGKLIASCLALTLAAGLVPSGGLAFAQEAAGQIINQTVPLNAQDAASSAEESADAAESSASSVNTAASEAADQAASASAEASANAASDSAAADEAAQAATSATPAASAAPGYTTGSIERISADVPVGGSDAVVVGNVEYEGLTYRINPDGQTASLAGLGTTAPKGELAVPAQIAAGGSLYQVTNIGSYQNLGGGVRTFCALWVRTFCALWVRTFCA